MNGCERQAQEPPVSCGVLILLRTGAVLVLLLVFFRLIYLQLVVAPVVLRREVPLDIRVRTLPASRGAIISSDGAVLARSQLRTVVAVHYRMFERPINRAWLARAAAREFPDLGPAEREARLLADVERLFERLSRYSGEPEHILQARAAAIRRRVRRIKQAVLRRHLVKPEAPAKPTSPGGLMEQLLELFADAQPRAVDRVLTVKEETWHYPLLTVDDPRIAANLIAHLHELPGVKIEQRSERDYPAGTLAGHIVGYVRPTGTPEQRDLRGEAGVEGYYDRLLRGQPGMVREQLFPGGARQVLSSLPPEPGADLRLTLDARLQRAVERSLAAAVASLHEEGAGGCAIVMHAGTGAIRAAASFPPVNPRDLADPASGGWGRLMHAAGSPLLNRVHQAELPPGSTFKLVVALAALRTGVVHANERIECHGYYGSDPEQHRCWVYAEYGRSHGLLTLSEALARSCNCYFYELAVRLGPSRLKETASLLGVGRKTNVDLTGERPGRWPVFPRAGSAPAPVALLNAGVGQGELLVTPLQVAVWTAAVASGYVVTPHVASGALAPRRRLPVPDAGLEAIRRGMRDAVAMPWGTANSALGDLHDIVGAKTGTAECGGRRPHSWCTAFVELKDEEPLVITVVIEHGGKGGELAAGVIRDVVLSIVPSVASSRDR